MRWVAFLALMLATLPASADERKLEALEHFDRIILDGAVELRLSQGDREEGTVVAEGDAQDVEVRVSRGRLVIHDSGSWRFWSKARPKVNVQVRELRQVVI